MTFFFYSLEDNILSVWMSVYVVHFNLQISSSSTTNLFKKYGNVQLHDKIMGFHIW
jgi:hypothetical protein